MHFIGQDKPWRGLLYRSPGIKSSEANLGDGTKRAYNYEALVDKWYEVYDRHYRQEPTLPTENFSLPRYASAWDGGGSLGAELPATNSRMTSGGGSGGPLGLEELRKLAVEGLNSTAPRVLPAIVPASSTEGEYRSMPLEGRVDLMRPQKQPDPTPQSSGHDAHAGPQDDSGEGPSTPRPTHISMPSSESGYFPAGMPPTPGPNEVPNAPYIHGRSLPPTATPTPYYGPPQGSGSQPSGELDNSLQVFYQPQVQSEPGPERRVDSQHWQWQEQQQRQEHQENQEQQHHRDRQYTQQQSYHPQPQSRPMHHQTSSQLHVPQQQQHTSYRLVPSTPQPRYTHESSDSDSPTPPAVRIPPHVARSQQHQQSQQQSQQHTAHHHHAHQSHHQPRSPGEQRVHTWAKEQQRTSRRPSITTSQGHGPAQPYALSQPQRARGDRTPPQGVQYASRTQSQHSGPGRPYSERRRSSPLASGQNTPTQGHPGGQRTPEVQRPRLRHHTEYISPQSQQREHRPHHEPHLQHPRPVSPQQQRVVPPPRPASPPKLSWNPAVEPPPKESPPISAFPEDTYFPNVWDQPSDATYQSFPSPERNPRSDVFFHPPPAPIIPAQSYAREEQSQGEAAAE